MKKKVFILSTIASILFSGCGRSAALTERSKNNAEYIDQIMTAVVNDDVDGLYNMFATGVQEDNQDLRADIEVFIDSIEGDYVGYKSMGGHESEGRDHFTAKYKYKITTSEKEYCLQYKQCDKYDDESKNGLVSLAIQELNDYNNDNCLYSQIETAYVVTEDNHQEITERFGHIVGRDVIVAKIDETTFPDEVLRNYILENFDNDISDGQLSKYELSYNTEIKLDGTADKPSKLKSLKGIEYLESLTMLRVDYSDVDEIDVSNNPNLEVLAIEHTNIKKVDLSNCPYMRILECAKDVEVIGYDGTIKELYSEE